jgi:uncharacterized membrane protein
MLNGEMGFTVWTFLRLVAFGLIGVLTLVLIIGLFTPRASRLVPPRRRSEEK